MATVEVKVVKTYRVEFETEHPIDHDAIMKKAREMVYRGDSEVVYEGTRASEIVNLEYTKEELAEVEAEQKADDDRSFAIEELLDNLNCKNVVVSLSVEDQEDIINGDVFAKGDDKYKFVYRGGFGTPYFSEVYYSPELSWEDVLIEADAAIHKSGDFHHIFLENVNDVGDHEGVRHFELIFGS